MSFGASTITPTFAEPGRSQSGYILGVLCCCRRQLENAGGNSLKQRHIREIASEDACMRVIGRINYLEPVQSVSHRHTSRSCSPVVSLFSTPQSAALSLSARPMRNAPKRQPSAFQAWVFLPGGVDILHNVHLSPWTSWPRASCSACRRAASSWGRYVPSDLSSLGTPAMKLK